MPSVTAVFSLAGANGRIVFAGQDFRQREVHEPGFISERRDGGVSHGDGAAVPCLHLRRHEKRRAARRVGAWLLCNALGQMLPRRAVKARFHADGHQFVIGRVVLDHAVADTPVRLVPFENRQVRVGAYATLQIFRTACYRAEGMQAVCCEFRALPDHTRLQNGIRFKQVYAGKRRALVKAIRSLG